jgi:hypothetical protein
VHAAILVSEREEEWAERINASFLLKKGQNRPAAPPLAPHNDSSLAFEESAIYYHECMFNVFDHQKMERGANGPQN